MHGRPAHHDSDEPVTASHPQRWQILGVLVLSLLVTSIDHTIINVALPQMVTVSGQLGENGTQLADTAREAFVSSMTSSLWVGVALAGVATVVAWTCLPKHAPSHSHGHVAHGHGHHSPHATAAVAINEAALSGNRPVQGPSKVPAVPWGESPATVASNDGALPMIGSPS